MTAEPLWTAADARAWRGVAFSGIATDEIITRRDVFETAMRYAAARRTGFLIRNGHARTPQEAVFDALDELDCPNDVRAAIMSFVRASCADFGVSYERGPIDPHCRAAIARDLEIYSAPCRRPVGRPITRRNL